MKRALCFILMLWLALQAGMVQAHTPADAGHAPVLAVQTLEQGSHPDAVIGEHCHLAHCGHALGLPPMHAGAAGELDDAITPACVPRLASRLAPHEVERPKWAAATQIV